MTRFGHLFSKASSLSLSFATCCSSKVGDGNIFPHAADEGPDNQALLAQLVVHALDHSCHGMRLLSGPRGPNAVEQKIQASLELRPVVPHLFQLPFLQLWAATVPALA